MEISSPFTVIVKANSQKNEILSHHDNELLVSVKAPADKGKANAELVKFLSKELGTQVRIKSGASSKTKRLVFV